MSTDMKIKFMVTPLMWTSSRLNQINTGGQSVASVAFKCVQLHSIPCLQISPLFNANLLRAALCVTVCVFLSAVR